eukprot:CAMPEP_0115302654 /NCGR_PEP_ID=MMETSP0270-20121206/70500_1 /TAXON_ID=71861 /ORGANISM="Scrippsiella trochoidea, Strain CCMP3099" /LENGTH=90 /DNA_ID=CAMNT_0002720599 /DNA_START=22 /DNA_END=294 /DNA_ORIENTATION=-
MLPLLHKLVARGDRDAPEQLHATRDRRVNGELHPERPVSRAHRDAFGVEVDRQALPRDGLRRHGPPDAEDLVEVLPYKHLEFGRIDAHPL